MSSHEAKPETFCKSVRCGRRRGECRACVRVRRGSGSAAGGDRTRAGRLERTARRGPRGKDGQERHRALFLERGGSRRRHARGRVEAVSRFSDAFFRRARAWSPLPRKAGLRPRSLRAYAGWRRRGPRSPRRVAVAARPHACGEGLGFRGGDGAQAPRAGPSVEPVRQRRLLHARPAALRVRPLVARRGGVRDGWNRRSRELVKVERDGSRRGGAARVRTCTRQGPDDPRLPWREVLCRAFEQVRRRGEGRARPLRARGGRIPGVSADFAFRYAEGRRSAYGARLRAGPGRLCRRQH